MWGKISEVGRQIIPSLSCKYNWTHWDVALLIDFVSEPTLSPPPYPEMSLLSRQYWGMLAELKVIQSHDWTVLICIFLEFMYLKHKPNTWFKKLTYTGLNKKLVPWCPMCWALVSECVWNVLCGCWARCFLHSGTCEEWAKVSWGGVACRGGPEEHVPKSGVIRGLEWMCLTSQRLSWMRSSWVAAGLHLIYPHWCHIFCGFAFGKWDPCHCVVRWWYSQSLWQVNAASGPRRPTRTTQAAQHLGPLGAGHQYQGKEWECGSRTVPFPTGPALSPLQQLCPLEI